MESISGCDVCVHLDVEVDLSKLELNTYRAQNPIAHQKKTKRSGHNMRMNSTLHVSMCFSTYTQPLQFIVANSIFVLLLDQLLAMCDLVHMNRFRFEHFYNNNKKTKTKQLNSCNELLFVFSAVYVHIFYFHGCVCFRPHFWFCTKREHHLILPPNRMKFVRRCWIT